MRVRALMAETSTWDFDWTPPGFRTIDRPDVRAWCYHGGWAGSRGVGRVRWTDGEIERCQQRSLSAEEMAIVRREAAEGF